ncbi:MAG: hypothetical protein ACOC1L_00640, partial [Bacillota bacterium]
LSLLMKKGYEQEEAEEKIIDKLGSVSDFKQSLGITDDICIWKDIASTVFFSLHIFFNITMITYFVAIYLLNTSISDISLFHYESSYYIATYIFITASINILSMLYMTIKAQYFNLEIDKEMLLFMSVVTLPMGIFGFLYGSLLEDNSFAYHNQAKLRKIKHHSRNIAYDD